MASTSHWQEQQYKRTWAGALGVPAVQTPLIVTIEIAGATKSFDRSRPGGGNLYARALLGLKECRGGQER